MTATSHRPVEYMRADAARNVHRIVEVAARLLGEDAHAGMTEVAAAAGVSRATVYRHFATRESLIGAIQQQAVEQAERALESSRLNEGSATDALRRRRRPRSVPYLVGPGCADRPMADVRPPDG